MNQPGTYYALPCHIADRLFGYVGRYPEIECLSFIFEVETENKTSVQLHYKLVEEDSPEEWMLLEAIEHFRQGQLISKCSKGHVVNVIEINGKCVRYQLHITIIP